MAWVDTMRLRRRADKIRAFGWLNLLLAIAWTVVHSSEGLHVLAFTALWAAAALGATHGIAWIIDKHAERVVRR